MRKFGLSGRSSALLILLLGAVIAGGLFWFWRSGTLNFDWNQFWATFTQLDAPWFAAGVLLVLLTYVGRALRWQVMMKPVAPNSSFFKILSATVIGFTGIVLFGRPGELIRPYLIAMRERTPFSAQMAIWLLERIWDLLIVLIMFGFALTQVHIDASTLGAGMQWLLRTGGVVVGVLCLVCVGILLMISVFSEAAQRRIREAMPVVPERFRGRIEDILISFAGGMKSTRSGVFTGKIFAYSVAEWLIIVAATWCLLRCFPHTSRFSLVDSAVFIGFVAFGSVVQIPGIGGGMQVASVLILTELFGVELGAASGAAVLMWLTMYVFIVPIGVALALREGIKWRELSHIAETAERPE